MESLSAMLWWRKSLIIWLASLVAFSPAFIQKLVSKEGASFLDEDISVYFLRGHYPANTRVLNLEGHSPEFYEGSRRPPAEGRGGYHVLFHDVASPDPSSSVALSTGTVTIQLHFSSSANAERVFSLCIHRVWQIEAFNNRMRKKKTWLYWIFGLKVNQESWLIFVHAAENTYVM